MSVTMRGWRPLVVGPSGVRAGWRLLCFVALLFLFNRMALPLQRWLAGGGGEAAQIIGEKVRLLGVFLLASAIMGWLEGRRLADYGLPWRRMFCREFWQGAALGVGALTVLVASLWATGALRFQGLVLHGAAIPVWAVAYGLVFVLVGVEEEFYYRGYGLFTLADGIAFWPAAVLLSATFGFSHFNHNPNETWLGVSNAALGGLVFCLFLRRTGHLWFPIGFHAGWDWAQTYFYGVADSGHTAPPGHLLSSTTAGPAWLSGGAVGPEGSVLCLALLLVLALAFAIWRRDARYPGAQASPRSGRP